MWGMWWGRMVGGDRVEKWVCGGVVWVVVFVRKR